MKTKPFITVAFGSVLLFFSTGPAPASDCYTDGPGCLDPTFGALSGKVLVNTDGSISSSFDLDVANGVAIQADGKIVAAGVTTLPGNIYKFVVVRANIDGSLDSTFGGTGVVTTSFSTGSDRAYAVALQSDGKIVVAGLASAGSSNVFAVARYLSDGALDPSFAIDGETTVSFGKSKQTSDSEARSVAIQVDGKILVAGFTGGSGALARLNTDGSLDVSFGSGGKVTNSVGGTNVAVAIQFDGRIVMGGSTKGRKTGYDFLVTRYNSNGSVDTGFGTAGLATTDFSGFDDQINVLVIDAGNNIVAGGYSSTAAGPVAKNFAVARFTPDGLLDFTFGSGGKVSTDGFGNFDNCNALALQADGKILAAGYAYVSATTGFFALIRYNINGTLDGSFGTNGIVTTNFAGGTHNYAYGIVIQPDGKIVAAGTADTPDSTAGFYVALARYFP